MTTHSPLPLPTRRCWFQFSLRTLMLVMLIFGCVLGWVGAERERRSKCQAILSKAGRQYSFDYHSDRPDFNWLDLIFGPDDAKWVVSANFSPGNAEADLLQLKYFTRLNKLTLGSYQISAEISEQIAKLEDLESLWLSDTQVSPDCIAHLAHAKKIRTLLLYHNKSANQILAAFAHSKQMTTVLIGYCNITDEGLAWVCRWT